MKKKSKDSKETTKGKNNKKITLLIVSIVILLICAIVLGTCLYFNRDGNLAKKDEKIVKDELILESGEKVPKVDDFALKDDILSSKSEIKYTKMSKNDEDDDNYDLRKVTIYLDKDNNEVSKDVAYEDDKLKDDYTEQEIVYSTGTYKVEIKDNEKIYTSKLVVQDTTKPVLKVKDITITEGDNVDATNFFERCDDNSREACNTLYFVKEVKTEDSTTYEKTELDKTVGEHEVLLRAEDASGNVSEVVKAKLTVNKKPEEPKPTTSNSGSSNKTTSSGSSSTKKPSSNGSSGSSSGSNSNSGSTSKPATNACGSKGYTYSQSVAYAFWGCNGSEPAGGLTSKINDELFGPAGEKELNACNAHFGNHDCSDWASAIPILDNATGKVVGYYVKFQMEYGGWGDLQVVGTGYMLPGRVVMTSKSY